MANNIITSVRKEIERLKKEINRRGSELLSLKDDLRKHQRVFTMFGGDRKTARRRPGGRKRTRRARKTRGRAGKRAQVNWNSVLEKLPQRFTMADVAKADGVKGKSPVYLRQIAVRWRKQGKIKRIRRGTYQKAGQKKPRAKAA